MTQEKVLMFSQQHFSLSKVSNILYIILLVFLPTQFGKHFWPSFTLINGLRLDYLSPTIYVTDLLILVLLGLWIVQVCHFEINSRKISYMRLFTSFRVTNEEFGMTRKKINLILLALSLAVIVIGIVLSKNPLAGWYGLLKLGEVVFFGFYTAHVLGKTVSYKAASLAILSGMLFESGLAIMQLLLHGSVGGLFYFFGERSFSMTTPGIANASIQGSLVLRPYGTLPHPNVLAAFLLLGCLFSLGQWDNLKKQKMFFSFVSIFSFVVLFLTLSRTTILVCFLVAVIGGYTYFKKEITKKMMIGVSCGIFTLLLLLFITPVGSRLMGSSTGEEAVVVREDLATNALWMIQTHPLFGVGLQNFYNNLPQSLSVRSYYTQMQPVHNIYLLVFAQGGLVVGLLFLYFLYKTGLYIFHVKGSFPQACAAAMFGSVLFLGMFDHYFITVQQGQLLLAFVIGYCYSFKTATTKKRKKTYNKNL